MQLVAVLVVLLAAAVSGGLADVHLFCDCSTNHHKDWTYALHCSRGQNAATGVSCQKAGVPDIPRGYSYIPGYALVKVYRTFRLWKAAKKFCEDEGARLAVPPNKPAYDGLKQAFNKERGISYGYIGISDFVSEGVFVGIDGLPVSYLPWQPNEPNDGGGEGEDCVIVRNDGLINDHSCNKREPFICERRLSVGVPNDYEWVDDAGRFYKVHEDRKTYADAVQICRSENATLAVTDTWRRGEAMLRIFDPKDEFYLIGFTDEAVEGDFVTETGRRLNDMEFQIWETGEPNNSNGRQVENCVAINSRGYFYDVACDLKWPFICEIAPL